MELKDLTAEQLTQVKQLLKEQKKQTNAGRADRYVLIDEMLQEKDGETFKNRTSDILEALQANGLVPPCQNGDKVEWLKRIQTRKQKLEKERNEDGTLKYAAGTFGYKLSAGGFNLTPDRIVDWLMDDTNVVKLTPADKKAILKSLS